MRVLLGSGGFRTAERIAFLVDQMHAFFGGIDRILFVPYALRDHDAYLEAMKQRRLDAGYRLEGIHHYPDPVEAVRQAQGIFVGGGNTFRLLDELRRRGLLDVIRERVLSGLPYLGVSAGCNVACPTIKTTNDMPITWPASLEAMALVSFQVNAHYFEGQVHVKTADGFREHFGETRDERIREFHEMNDAPVVGLWEAGTLWCEGGSVTLAGSAARIFRKGLPPVDVPPETKLDRFLTRTPGLLYTVAVTFREPAVAAEWLAWLRGGHLAEVIAGGAESAEVVEMDGEGKSFEVRYRFASREAFGLYELEHAPRLRAEGFARFGPERGVAYRRTVGVVV